ncbi:ABC transporter ATP-binding protein [Olivibacter ginsenosidimutans]|uniref:ABC transporter ATP-binding protein n=1 Tax=Olivibacter ginsenosidimutans TaxID=1176537 RepID=A0ABP9AZF2_9SPHI
MEALVIALDDVKFNYTDDVKLSFPRFTLRKGEHCLILGNSGSGKTTLIHMMCGLLRPSSGKVILNGVDIYGLSAKQLDHFRGQNIGLIFQQTHLIRSLTILENLQLARWLAGLKEDREELLLVLQRLKIADKATNYPHQLSQGQAQRAAIARALVNRPMFLIADEPTSSLDDHHAALVLDLLLDQSQNFGASLIIATHDKRVKDQIVNTYQL